MSLTEEELVETALLRYAQQAATKWGAERFAAEFARRDHEERWLRAARSNTNQAPHLTAVGPAPEPSLPSPLVDAAVRGNVVGLETGELGLGRPEYERHPSVPRPPGPEPEGERRRARRRKRDRSADGSGWTIAPAEAARMSPAGRRLYGLDAT